MSEELLRSLLSLFAIISNADGKLDDREVMYINVFLEDYLGKEYAKKYRRLFIKYFHYTQKQPITDNILNEICQRINNNLDKKQKIIALARLLEISVFNEDYKGHKRALTADIALKLRIDVKEFEALENFIYASNNGALMDHSHLAVFSSTPLQQQHTQVVINEQLHDTNIWILRNEKADLFFVKFTGAAHEVLLNFNVIKNNLIYILHPGASIKMETGFNLHFSDVSSMFTHITPASKFILNAVDVCYRFDDGSKGLDHVSLSEGPGRLIAILGGSGSGKTTLLNVLSGTLKPTSGSVTINNLDLNNKEDAQQLKGFIGYVAQEDVLIEELTVYQNLYFNAQLCFNKLSEQKIHGMVIKTLKDLGIYHIRNIRVGDSQNKKISGGQRKRLNIALELIREPSILLLDEPTSGLSSRDSDNVMDFLKQLSYKGKLIITVIHQPSVDIYNMFDKVVIMDYGGAQIYYGNPNEAINYFKAYSGNIKHKIRHTSLSGELNSPELIFHIVEEELVDEYGNHTGIRKLEPTYWQNLFKKQQILAYLPVHTPITKNLDIPSRSKQFKVFFARDFLSKLHNTQYLRINMLVAPCLAFILAFIVRSTEDFSGKYTFSQNENIPAYIFISIIVSLFMGMTLSAGEIIKDNKLLSREKFLHLSRLSYLLSKLALLFLISAIQTILFISIANHIVEFKGMNLHYGLMFFSTSCFANILGLLISSTFYSFIAVYIAIPLLLIPQMILSGSVFSYDRLNKYISSKDKVPVLADLTVSRWAYEGLLVHQYKNNVFQRTFFELESKESATYYKFTFWNDHLINKANALKLLVLEKPENYQSQVSEIVTLLQNELINEPLFRYDSENFKLLRKGNYQSILSLIQELEYLKEYYSRQYRMYAKMQDQMVITYMKNPKYKALFINTRNKYTNYAIANLVRNKNSKFKIQEYKHQLIQKIDPIYRKPNINAKWYEYRTHFFSPEKNMLGMRLDTYWANMIAIWIINTFFFILLYLNVPKYVVYFKINIR